MQKLIYTNSQGVSIDLTTDPFGITEWEGFSNVEMEVQSQTVPFQDGSVYIDNLLSNRELSITVAINDNNNLSKRYELRRQLIAALNPKLGEGTLTYRNNFLEKQITVIPATPIFQTHNSDTQGTPKAQVSFTACQPYWEDTENTLVNFSLTEQPVVQNAGDVETQVKIKISGQSTNPKITNVTTGSSIGLSGLITEAIDINTACGKKSVTGSEMKWTNIFGGYLNSIANKGDSVVLVGTDGAILYSFNALEWKSQLSNTIKNLNGVCSNYNFDLFVAVGDDGTILYSLDGKTWADGTCSSSEHLNSITSSTSQFVAVGDGGAIVISSDGHTFSDIVSPTSENLNCVIYDGAQYIAVGDSGILLKSSDGQQWDEIRSNTDRTLYSVAYNVNAGLYIAVGVDGTMIQSVDAEEWQVVENLPTTENLRSITFQNYLNEYFIVGDDGTLLTGLSEWTLRDTSTEANYKACLFVKDLGITLLSGSGILQKSANNEDWEKCINIVDTILHDVIYIPKLKLYLASGSDGNIFVSTNGTLWEARNIGIDVDIYALALNPNTTTIIGVGTGGTIVRSFNGYTWEKIKDGAVPYTYYLLIDGGFYFLINSRGDKLIIEQDDNNGKLCDIVYSDRLNKFIAVGYQGKICTSVDGIAWNEETRVTDECLNSITINEGLIVAVGDNGTVITSRNGTDWTLINSGLSFDIMGVTSSPTKTRFLAVGKSGYIAFSKDGVHWELRRINADRRAYIDFTAVCYSEVYSQFIAVGKEGLIAVSVDGQTWEETYTESGLNYSSIIFSNNLGKYISVGNKGTVMSSYTDNAENLISKISPNSDINFNLVVGQNLLRVSCESGDPRVTIEFRNKYIGV